MKDTLAHKTSVGSKRGSLLYVDTENIWNVLLCACEENDRWDIMFEAEG